MIRKNPPHFPWSISYPFDNEDYTFNEIDEINKVFINNDWGEVIYGPVRTAIIERWMRIVDVRVNKALEKENEELSERVKELESQLELEKENLEDFIDKSEKWNKNKESLLLKKISEKDCQIFELENLLKKLEYKFEEKLNLIIEKISS